MCRLTHFNSSLSTGPPKWGFKDRLGAPVGVPTNAPIILHVAYISNCVPDNSHSVCDCAQVSLSLKSKQWLASQQMCVLGGVKLIILKCQYSPLTQRLLLVSENAIKELQHEIKINNFFLIKAISWLTCGCWSCRVHQSRGRTPLLRLRAWTSSVSSWTAAAILSLFSGRTVEHPWPVRQGLPGWEDRGWSGRSVNALWDRSRSVLHHTGSSTVSAPCCVFQVTLI